MTGVPLSRWLFFAGIGQLFVLIASGLVPLRLNWREELRCLPRLHKQMYWVYGGYVVLSIVAFAAITMWNAEELARGVRSPADSARMSRCFGACGSRCRGYSM